MANKQSAANQVVRALLNLLGEYRDSQVLGIAPGELRGKKIRASILADFDGKCAYCDQPISGNNFDIDHLVPMNKAFGGLHMYGNLVLSCKPCNADKHGADLETYLAKLPKGRASDIRKRLLDRSAQYGSDFDRDSLKTFADRVYQETLQFIERRVQQGIEHLPAASSKVNNTRAPKVEHDFSEIAKTYPLGSLVRSTKDGAHGTVFDYSMEGPKGKRTAYVRFHREPDHKSVTRAPSTLEVLTRL